jgi:hypothetical protein
MKPLPLLACAVAAACAGLLAGDALAAPGTSSEVETLVKRGNELRKEGKDHEALPLFQRAYETAATPRTAAQLGLCEMQLGYWLAADDHLREALAGQRDTWIDKYRPVIDESLQKVQKRIGEIRVTGSPAGASVTINGRTVGTIPLGATRVVAGPVRVEVAAANHQVWNQTVTVQSERPHPLIVNLEPLVATVPPPKPSDDRAPGWGTGKITGASLIGAGVLALAGGTTLLLLDKRPSCALQMAGDQCAERTRTHIPGWSLVGAAVVAGLVGGFVFYRSSDDEVTAAVGPSSLVLRGRF